jgi:hypothetical protein
MLSMRYATLAPGVVVASFATGTLSPVLEVSSGHDACEVEVRRRDLRHTGDVPAADRLVQ